MKPVAALAFAATVAAASTAMACPNWQLAPAFGTIQLIEGFPQDPYARSITAGGRYALANCFPGYNFRGSVAQKPDFDVHYSTSGAS